MTVVMKEYNVKQDHTTKQSYQFYEILGQERVEKIEHLKKLQGVFTINKKDSELVTKLRSKLCESMEKKQSLSVMGNS